MHVVRHSAYCNERTTKVIGDAPNVFVDMVKVVSEYWSPFALDVKNDVNDVINVGIRHIVGCFVSPRWGSVICFVSCGAVG